MQADVGFWNITLLLFTCLVAKGSYWNLVDSLQDFQSGSASKRLTIDNSDILKSILIPFINSSLHFLMNFAKERATIRKFE